MARQSPVPGFYKKDILLVVWPTNLTLFREKADTGHCSPLAPLHLINTVTLSLNTRKSLG